VRSFLADQVSACSFGFFLNTLNLHCPSNLDLHLGTTSSSLVPQTTHFPALSIREPWARGWLDSRKTVLGHSFSGSKVQPEQVVREPANHLFERAHNTGVIDDATWTLSETPNWQQWLMGPRVTCSHICTIATLFSAQEVIGSKVVGPGGISQDLERV
jgi:hypothetical protein